jgi:hypothetical protein
MPRIFVNIFQVFKDNLFCLVDFTECHDVSYNELSLLMANCYAALPLTTQTVDAVCLCQSVTNIDTDY